MLLCSDECWSAGRGATCVEKTWVWVPSHHLCEIVLGIRWSVIFTSESRWKSERARLWFVSQGGWPAERPDQAIPQASRLSDHFKCHKNLFYTSFWHEDVLWSFFFITAEINVLTAVDQTGPALRPLHHSPSYNCSYTHFLKQAGKQIHIFSCLLLNATLSRSPFSQLHSSNWT